MKKKILAGSFALAMLAGCTTESVTLKRGGDNTGFKDWAVEYTFKPSTKRR